MKHLGEEKNKTHSLSGLQEKIEIRVSRDDDFHYILPMMSRERYALHIILFINCLKSPFRV